MRVGVLILSNTRRISAFDDTVTDCDAGSTTACPGAADAVGIAPIVKADSKKADPVSLPIRAECKSRLLIVMRSTASDPETHLANAKETMAVTAPCLFAWLLQQGGR